MTIFLAFFTSFITCYLAIPKLISFAVRYRLFAPRTERAIHEGKIPSLGGIAICAACLFALILWSNMENIQFTLVSLVIVFFVGILDDLLSLSPYKKIVGQVVAILIIIYLQELRIDNMYSNS